MPNARSVTAAKRIPGFTQGSVATATETVEAGEDGGAVEAPGIGALARRPAGAL
ncbi:MAG TPA: hypothetical protein VFE47_10625 [Tepidisphaeraceae bacterium]|nr:hypothetical protein [Tepidisphaeraceae bacterium]